MLLFYSMVSVSFIYLQGHLVMEVIGEAKVLLLERNSMCVYVLHIQAQP